jgi:hypothetical protein
MPIKVYVTTPTGTTSDIGAYIDITEVAEGVGGRSDPKPLTEQPVRDVYVNYPASSFTWDQQPAGAKRRTDLFKDTETLVFAGVKLTRSGQVAQWVSGKFRLTCEGAGTIPITAFYVAAGADPAAVIDADMLTHSCPACDDKDDKSSA